MTTSCPEVVAIFARRGQAEAAIDELVHEHFDREQIGIAVPGGQLHEADTPTERLEEKAATGAVAGAVTGASVGAVAGALVAAFIPGVGPILAGGILAGVVGGAAAGAAAGAYAGPFIALGFSEDEARRYADELRAGRTLVTVRTGERTTEARLILERHGGQVREVAPTPAGAVR